MDSSFVKKNTRVKACLKDLRSYLDSSLVAIKPFQRHVKNLSIFKEPPSLPYLYWNWSTPTDHSLYFLRIFKGPPSSPPLPWRTSTPQFPINRCWNKAFEQVVWLWISPIYYKRGSVPSGLGRWIWNLAGPLFKSSTLLLSGSPELTPRPRCGK